MTKRFATGVALLCLGQWGLLAGSLHAQQTAATNTSDTEAAPTAAATPAATETLPSVQEIVTKSVNALGGRDAWMRTSSLRTKGLIQSEDSSTFLGVEVLQKAPGKALMKITLPNGMALRQVCDGKTAWVEDFRGGYHEFKGAELEYRLKHADLLDDIKALDEAMSGKLLGVEKIGTHTAYVVEVSDKKEVRRLYFDKDSGLIVHAEEVFKTPEPYTVKRDLDDYREVAGLKFPFREKVTQKGAITTVKLTQVTVNPVVEDANFYKPESAK